MTDWYNVSKIARTRAGLTQERWAESLDISPEAVSQYETGKIRPTDEVVLRMAEVSGHQIICYWHMLNKSRVAQDLLPEVQSIPLPQAVIQLIVRIREFDRNHRADDLMNIAADGVVDDLERPEFDQIVEELRGVIQAAMQVKFSPQD